MKPYLVVAKYSMSIMLFCLLILILDSVLTLNLNQYGIVPRSTTHFIGIVIAPFLHANWAHLFSNFFPFIILASLIGLHSAKRFVFLLPFFIVTTGLLVWIFARGNSIHIGMSGVIYAFWGFLLVYGVVRRQFISIMISLITLFFYGGLVFGVFPGQIGVSFESHLIGAVVGALTGYCLAK